MDDPRDRFNLFARPRENASVGREAGPRLRMLAHVGPTVGNADTLHTTGVRVGTVPGRSEGGGVGGGERFWLDCKEAVPRCSYLDNL